MKQLYDRFMSGSGFERVVYVDVKKEYNNNYEKAEFRELLPTVGYENFILVKPGGK